MRKSLSITLVSLSCLALFLPLTACTHTDSPADESLQISSEPETSNDADTPKTNAPLALTPSEEEAAIVEQIAPNVAPPAPENSESGDFLNPSEVGLTQGAPDTSMGELDSTYTEPAPAPKKKSKAKGKSKAQKKVRANLPLEDGTDSSALQSESTLSDPTSHVAEASVIFSPGSAVIPKKYQAKLVEVAHQLQADRKLKVVLSGHADSTSNAKRNRALAKKRAQAVKSLLLKNGVKAAQVQIEAAKPLLASNRDAARKLELFLK